jgi:hypothetical protein
MAGNGASASLLDAAAKAASLKNNGRSAWAAGPSIHAPKRSVYAVCLGLLPGPLSRRVSAPCSLSHGADGPSAWRQLRRACNCHRIDATSRVNASV